MVSRLLAAMRIVSHSGTGVQMALDQELQARSLFTLVSVHDESLFYWANLGCRAPSQEATRSHSHSKLTAGQPPKWRGKLVSLDAFESYGWCSLDWD